MIDPLGIKVPNAKTNTLVLDEKAPSPEIDIARALAEEKGNDLELSNRLKVMAKTAGVGIYCGYFPRALPVRGPELKTRGSLHALLNETAHYHGYHVTRHGDGYFLWSKTRFFERPNLIPEQQLAKWRKRCETGQPYLFEQILEMARLTDGQLEMLCRTPLRPNIHAFNQKSLRLIAGLTSPQRQQAFRPTGLPMTSMTPDQRAMFAGLLPADMGVVAKGRTQPSLRLESFGGNENPAVRITVVGPDGGERLTQVRLIRSQSGFSITPL